ncbi:MULTISPECIES: zf-HC2 domain-containing protein [unclassified Streptomyces]|uniref:anti-sigma factor family protein n=1 Tax=unclassified Streptomyces TaxID=2593676 RepID=UPI002DDA2FE4|nr:MULTISPECIES: zf-HC2 domain-containing protein [unclassified Streptomyces]WSB76894.1 zf-HC2 domain-containing protein [Streptomyces sp. NBC_01775]WSS14833.1 zf-HC2 domain-containing protein [Streptomyces sp. NBC_01186]WSS43667.1 zf-HC2 domain-containing protein [Streptomyces sp. NBC_01187]
MTPAEHHLGDRLAALVDGELGHDARERVLSHLATCHSCKAEADAQRRLKNVFADTAPPPPSDGLLARLQGLPAGGDACAGRADDTDRDTDGSGPGAAPADESGALPMAGLPGGPQRSPWAFDYLPVGRGAGRGLLTPQRGFRIHEVRVDRAERSASRGRRFAFAAAGAFSLAALALGGSLASGTTGGAPVAKGDGGGASASPVRTAPSGSGTTSRDSRRRTPGGEHRGGALSASAAEAQTAATFAAGAARGSGVVSSARGGTAAAAPSLIAALAAPLGPSAQRLSPATGASGSYGQDGGGGTFTSLTSTPSLGSRGVGPLMSGARPASPSYDPSSLRAFPGRSPATPSPMAGR